MPCKQEVVARRQVLAYGRTHGRTVGVAFNPGVMVIGVVVIGVGIDEPGAVTVPN